MKIMRDNLSICSDGYSGKKCECDGESGQSSIDEKCRKENWCNGKGDCNCGKCKCHPGYVGEKCTCDVEDCPGKTNNGQYCSGNGACDTCSEALIPGCTCNPGWSNNNGKNDCSCLDSKVLNFWVESWELSHLTRDLPQLLRRK